MHSARTPVELSWPAEAESVPLARHAVCAYLGEARVTDPPLGAIALVVSEAVSNVVVHAYRQTPSGDVRVALAFEDDELCLTVEDDGDGLLPRPDSPGLGVGLPLIAALATRLQTHSTVGGGTRLRAWFTVPAAAAAGVPSEG